MKTDNPNTWTEKDFLNDLWERSSGKKFPKPKRNKPLPELKAGIQEAMKDFNYYADNRLLMGAFRYGEIDIQNYGKYDLIGECNKRIELYNNEKNININKKPNLEHIIDAANMLRLMFYWEMKNGGELRAIDRKD
jgi:hypothetical protein